MDDELFNRRWWDKLQINMREGKPGTIGLHVFKGGMSCRYFEVPEAEFSKPTIWQHLRDLSDVAWKGSDGLDDPCPHCSFPMRMWARRYEGYQFCGNCGTPLPKT